MPDLSRYDGRTPEPPYQTPSTEDFQAEHIAALAARVAELEAAIRYHRESLTSGRTVCDQVLWMYVSREP